MEQQSRLKATTGWVRISAFILALFALVIGVQAFANWLNPWHRGHERQIALAAQLSGRDEKTMTEMLAADSPEARLAILKLVGQRQCSQADNGLMAKDHGRLRFDLPCNYWGASNAYFSTIRTPEEDRRLGYEREQKEKDVRKVLDQSCQAAPWQDMCQNR